MDQRIEPEKSIESSIDREIANKPKDGIPGWGMDHDPENDPTYPMKKWNGADHERLNYSKPEQQPVTVEVLHSNERPGITRVFGTSVPPEGLSGRIRRFAFRYSESSYGHWVPLILADRIAVYEGLIDDLKKGIFPNIFAERGWQAEWKYNRQGLLKNLAIAAGVSALLIMLMRGRRRQI